LGYEVVGLYSSQVESLDLASIKERWNDVLDELLSRDRILWLAYFDARLVSYKDGELVISFSDPQKFSGEHDFSLARKPMNLAALEDVVHLIYDEKISVQEAPEFKNR